MIPLVSIVTICFRNPDELEGTLKSFAGLDFGLVETVVIDGSPDNACAAVAERMEAVVTTYRHGPDAGIFDAYNKGLAAAHGASVICINSGDALVDAGHFNAIVARHVGDLPAKIVYGDHRFRIGAEDIPVRSPRVDAAAIRRGSLPMHPAIFVPASWYATHPYDTAFRIAADTKLMRQAFSDLGHVQVHEPIAVFVYGGISSRPGTWRQVMRAYRESIAARDMTWVQRLAMLRRRVQWKLIGLIFGDTRVEQMLYARAKARSEKEAKAP